MSVRNLLTDHNKSWLQINSNTTETLILDINNGSVLNIEAGGIIEINTDQGSINEIIKKDGSNNIVYGQEKIFGQDIQYFSALESSTTSTSSGSFIPVPGTQWTTSSLSIGTYLLYTTIEMRNIAGNGAIRVVQDPSGTPIILYTHNQTMSQVDYWASTFFIPIVIGSIGTQTFEFEFQKPSGPNPIEVRKARFVLHRVS
jgi:hypothetical protein